MKDCIFCKIVNNEIPAEKVYEDDDILAFEDINPKAPVHILLIPKQHFASLNEIPKDQKEILSHLMLTARKIASEKKIGKKGYRIVLNTGKDSGQEVFHIHLHLFGGRRMTWPPG
ncbi:MAG: HIT domain-containing protein [Candidatus Aminicenantes bacterium]|nr:HIT domain-containing protein [Candidatus Aminicenantes bacterium]